MDHEKAADAAFDATVLEVGAGMASFDAETLDLMRRWFALGYGAGAMAATDDMLKKFTAALDGPLPA